MVYVTVVVAVVATPWAKKFVGFSRQRVDDRLIAQFHVRPKPVTIRGPNLSTNGDEQWMPESRDIIRYLETLSAAA